ncbi:uncharacterized protein N7458_009257 [Penicillium daleae]|uniref:Uncharacterized protein n=1 Tax=Penicillium daleae TaxID=63821 RepID=A0AAD6BWL1_9EURO|nr:uncharacterized protein N7458_009257 [Penicillium daleae]KAJ5438259.1 hypothetical protein N7458_009257 [Penicillium daleae]
MKFQATFGTLVTLAVAALAVPVENVSERVVLSGDQLKSIINVFKNSGKPDILAPDQTISCSVAYTLALSSGPPPYTLSLTSLDLSACTLGP